jgi:hypothetical protein
MNKKILIIGALITALIAYYGYSSYSYIPNMQGTLAALDCPVVLPNWTNKYQTKDTQLLFSTAEKELNGLYLQQINSKGELVNRFKEDSWKIGGTLGSFTFDKNKNLYLVPTPIIYIGNNPKQERQSIFKVDSETGVMTKWMDIEVPEEIKKVDDNSYLYNTYGNIGITGDCKTNKLYVSSVQGSDKDKMRGRVYEVDINTMRSEAIITDMDCYGIYKVEDSSRGTYLLFGNTRESSMGLYDFGSKKIKNQELVINNPNVLKADYRVKKIRLKGDTFEIGLYPFDYTLATSGENLNAKLNYQYKDGKWAMVNGVK